MATVTVGTEKQPMDQSLKEGKWYSLSTEEVADALKVDPSTGLSPSEAQQRLEKNGPNQMAAKEKESGWHAFLRQYKDFMQILLLVTAIIALVLVHQVGTFILLIVLTIFNAVLGLRGEAKAAASLAELQKTLKNIVRVRRGGEAIEIPQDQVVPGDIALIEAGNIVPADGRLIVAATLETEEGALTGESTPVLKDTDPISKEDVPLGDRVNMVFMNSAVTRGRGEVIVTGTGMNTEIGHIARLLDSVEADKTPLQKQLDRLTVVIAAIAGVAFIIMVAIGLSKGQPFQQLFTAGIALAISAIPTGMPAVVTTLYSIGTRTLAEQNAIVKRLPSVETLGSVSAICSDKTGTLTLNKMTAREFSIPGQNRYKVSGEGYSTVGQLMHTGASQQPIDLDVVLLPMALCADARLDGENLIGDPTEGALIVLAEKGGIDVEGARREYPRIAEVPFDAEYKFMATFHRMKDEQGKDVVRCFVKGAPDVLIARGGSYWLPEGQILPVTEDNRHLALNENDRMAKAGERVMVVARRDFDPATFDPRARLIDLVNDLTLLAMVGIVDPPRAEARDAIAKCKSAGIQVRMITGDHAVTAAAIGKELGILGNAITGAQFSATSDEELIRELPDLGVIARVAPEDKIHLVHLLQQNGNIVAMTGDGVNDAPALKKADIGVAMGITGTEVSKESAVMILTDDNFATIVKAVEFGRAIYDNLSKYIRFQMETLVGFITSYLGAAIFGIAGGIPFTPLQVLWINFFVDVPIAAALGFDKPAAGLMVRKPRPIEQPVLNLGQWVRIIVLGVLMAVGTLAVRAYFEPLFGATVATTMALTTFSLFNVAAGLCTRSETQSVLNRDIFGESRQVTIYGLTLLIIYLATQLNFLQRLLSTDSMSGDQWLICFGVALTLVVVDEIWKIFLRRSVRRTEQVEPVAAVSMAQANTRAIPVTSDKEEKQ